MSFYNEEGRLEKELTYADIESEIEKGTDVNEIDWMGNTILWNIIDSNIGIKKVNQAVSLLLEHGADTERTSGEYERTVLFVAVDTSSIFRNEHLKLIEILLRHGANPNAKDTWGDTPLSHVKDLETLKLFIEYGADINIVVPQRNAVKERTYFDNFFYDTLTKESMRMIAYMLEHGAMIDTNDWEVQNRFREIIFENFEDVYEYNRYNPDFDSSIIDDYKSEHKDLVQCIDSIYHEYIKDIGLDTIIDRILEREKQINPDDWISSTCVTIPEDVYIVPENSFSNNDEIEKVVIHGNVREIGRRAFYGCSNLKQITFIHNGICIVGDEAFANCTNLNGFEVPNCTIIGKRAFMNCISMRSFIAVESDEQRNKYYESYEKKYGSGKCMWDEEAFANCILLEKLLDFYVEGVGKSCFLGCKNLIEVNCEMWVVINDFAFWGCTSLKKILVGKHIDESDYTGPWDTPVMKLGKYVFPFNEYDMFSLGTVGLIGSYGDVSLHTENVQQELSQKPYSYNDEDDNSSYSYDYMDDDFYSTNNNWNGDYYEGSSQDYWEDLYAKADYDPWDHDYNEYEENTGSPEDFWENLYAKGDDILNVLEEDIIKGRIPPYIVTTTIHDALETIPEETSILKYASGVSTIGLHQDGLFLGFVLYEDINKILGFTLRTVIKNGQKVIERYTFKNSSICAIEIPPNVEDLEEAFSGCYNLKKVFISDRCKGIIFDGTFCETAIDSCILPESTERLNYTFVKCENLKSVSFWKEPKNLINLSYTFKDCKKLKEFVIPASVESLNGTFSNCISLEKIVFSKGSELKVIGPETFKNCIHLKELVFPSCVYIDKSAFSDCISLEKVIIKGDIEIMGDIKSETSVKEMFEGCIMLKKVIIDEKEILLV